MVYSFLILYRAQDAWYQYEGDRGPSRSASQAGTDGIPPTKLKGILGQLFKGKGKLAPHARVSKLPPQLSPLDGKLPPQLSPLDGKLPPQLSPLDEWTQFDPLDERDVGALFKPIVPRAFERSLPRLPDKDPDEPARQAALEQLMEVLDREERQAPEAIDARLPNPHDYEPREERDSPEFVSPEPQMQETIYLDSMTSDAETQVSPQSIQERRSQTSTSQNFDFLNPLIYPYQGRQVPSVRAQTLDNRVPTSLYDWPQPLSSQTVSPAERKLNNPWPLIEDASVPPVKQSFHNPWPIIEDEDPPAEDESMPRDFSWSRISPQPPLKESPGLAKHLELPPPVPPPFISNEFLSKPLNQTRATPYAASSSSQPVTPPASSSFVQPFLPPPLPRRKIGSVRNQMRGSQPQPSSSAQPVAPLLIDVPRRSETLAAMPPPRHPQVFDFDFDFDQVFATLSAGPSSVQPVAPPAIDTLRISQSTAVQQPPNREYIFGQGHGEQSTGSSSAQPVTPPLLSELTVANQSHHLTHDVGFNFDQMRGEQSAGRSSTQSAVPSPRSVPSEVPIKSESPETIQSHRSTHDDEFVFDQIQGEQSVGPSSPQLVTPSPRSLHSEVPLESEPEIIQSHPLTHDFGFIFDQMQSASPPSLPANEPIPLPQIPDTVGNELAEIPHPGGNAHAFDPDEDIWYTEEEHSPHEQQLGVIEESEYDKSSVRTSHPCVPLFSRISGR
jgi:hypothetical protein